MESDQKAEIAYEDFAKLDIRIGEVVAAEMVPDADKLIKCTVDFGELGMRTIVSGIAEWKDPAGLRCSIQNVMFPQERASNRVVPRAHGIIIE